jgi:outer membrane protein assembly factor BamD (BamD/ComL family)
MKQFFCVLVLVAFFTACSSVPEESEISEDLSVAELIQEAQNSFDKGSSRTAEVYYQVILNRYADNPEAVVAAQYELAHLKIKHKKWREALFLIDGLIQEYDYDISYQLPRSYLKLAQLDREKIPQKFLVTEETEE